jgi:tetratricopeptide (TPR) repeat protein
LDKTTFEKFDEKVNLIYEYDKKSPLFIRVANTEINNNNVEKAIGILNQGLNDYPQFAAAYLLLGRAYTLLGNYSLALKNIKTGSGMVHSKQTYDFYLNEIEEIKKQRSFFEISKRAGLFTSEEKDENENQVDMFKKESDEIQKTVEDSPIDERLEELAREISSAKISEQMGETFIDNQPSKKISESHIIISDTLAKIYTAQGEYKEAIEIYGQLRQKNPEKLEYYNQKIEELKAKL